MFFSIIFTSTEAESVNIYENKIDAYLKEKLGSMVGDENISVSVWVTDIDYDLEFENIKEALMEKINMDFLLSETIIESIFSINARCF